MRAAICVSMLCALMTSCGGSVEEEVQRDKRASQKPGQLNAARDDATCRSYGFQVGTPAYGDCRVKLAKVAPQLASAQARQRSN
jgi:hypothetical protein